MLQKKANHAGIVEKKETKHGFKNKSIVSRNHSMYYIRRINVTEIDFNSFPGHADTYYSIHDCCNNKSHVLNMVPDIVYETKSTTANDTFR